MREKMHGDNHFAEGIYEKEHTVSGLYTKMSIHWKGGYVRRGYNEKREHTHGRDKIR